MKRVAFQAFLIIALHGAFAHLQAEDPPSAEALKQTYDAEAALANKPVADFQRRYIEELEKLGKESQKAGRLDEFLAIQKESEEFRSGPVENLDQFPALKKLRGIYDSSLPAMKAKAREEQSQALQSYIGGVNALVTRLTSAGKIEEAVELNELKQRLSIEQANLQTSEGSDTPGGAAAVSNEPTIFVAEVATIPGLTGKSGRLRSVGTFSIGEEVIPPEAEDIDDFVRVYAYDRSWVGIRKDGSAFIKYIRPIKLTVHTAEIGKVERISRSHDGWMMTKRNEFWRVADPDKVFDTPKEPHGLTGSHCAGIAYRSDGMVVTGDGFGPEKRVPPPEGFFDGVVGACSGAVTMIAVDPGGTLRGWEIDTGQPYPFDGITDVVEIESGRDHALVRKKDGSVETFSIHSKRDFNESYMAPPSDLGGTVARIRAGGQTSVIQRTDGTWLAWGPNSMINDAINSVGIAIDLDVFARDTGYAIWIEPVE